MRFRRLVWLLGGVGLTGLVALAVYASIRPGHPIETSLAELGRVGVVGFAEVPLLAPGTEFIPVAPGSPVNEALRGREELELAQALREEELTGLLILGRHDEALPDDPSVLDRLRAYQHLPSVRGIFLSPDAAVYRPASPLDLPESFREATAVVARRILAGEPLPQLSSFPAALQERRKVEIVVILRDGYEARLWRSARGHSIARALVTASSLARQRWNEREGAMRDPLDDVLPSLDVEVALLEDDGTLGNLSDAWLQRAVSQAHGVGFEQRGSWRYLLPERTRRAGGGLDAYRFLLLEGEREPDYLHRPDVRPYRFVVTTLAVSPGVDADEEGEAAGEDANSDESGARIEDMLGERR